MTVNPTTTENNITSNAEGPVTTSVAGPAMSRDQAIGTILRIRDELGLTTLRWRQQLREAPPEIREAYHRACRVLQGVRAQRIGYQPSGRSRIGHRGITGEGSLTRHAVGCAVDGLAGLPPGVCKKCAEEESLERRFVRLMMRADRFESGED